MDNTDKKIKKLVAFTDDSGLAIFDELQDINDNLQSVNEIFGGVNLDGLDSIQGEQGEPGVPGRDGAQGPRGEKGEKGDPGREGYDGYDGIDGKDGADGRDGRDGKDGSPDTPEAIKSKLESLQGDDRLDAFAIKNLPKMIGKVASDGYPYGLPQPAGAITYKINGAPAGRGNTLNFVGTGITGSSTDDTFSVNLSGGGSFSLPITTNLAGGIVATYDQTNNFLGFGITAAGQTFQTSSPGVNILASLDLGGVDTTIVGYINTGGPGGAANSQYGYNNATDEAEVAIRANSLAGNSARITVSADVASSGIEFAFSGGGSYTFPNNTAAGANYVLTDVLGNGVLSWAPSGGSSSLVIGNPITGGGANRVLYEDGSNNLAESSNFAYSDSTGVFSITFGGGNRLLIDPNANRYEIGDSTGVNNKNYYVIDDGSNTTTAGTAQFWQVIDSNTSVQWITVDSPNSIVKIGDVNNALNGNRLVLQDAGNKITMNISSEFEILDSTSNFRYFDINPGTNNYAIGDLNNFNNFNYLVINDFAQQSFLQTLGTFAVQTIGGQRVLSTDLSGGTNFIFQAGDVDGGGNDTKIILDDTGKSINIESTGFIKVGDQLGLGNNTLIVVDDASSGIDARTFGAFTVTSPINNSVWLEASPSLGGFLGDGAGTANGTALRVVDTTFSNQVQNRFQEDYHGNTASANNMTLGNFGNTFTITGNVQINLMDSTNWQEGSKVTLVFTGTPTVKHNQAASGAFEPLFLAGSVDLVVGTRTVVTFVKLPSLWQEISRTVM